MLHMSNMDPPAAGPPATGSNNDFDEQSIRRSLTVHQTIIDFSIERLIGLRTSCATSEPLTQTEIRHLENKFMRMFAEFLVLNGRLPVEDPTSMGAILKNWLNAVGLSSPSIDVVAQHVHSMDALLAKTNAELVDVLQTNPNTRDVEWLRLQRANHNLRRCRAMLDAGEKIPGDSMHWDSWDRHNRSVHHKASVIKKVGSSNNLHEDNGITDFVSAIRRKSTALGNLSSTRDASTASPPASPTTLGKGTSNGSKRAPPSTPPPQRKYQAKSLTSPMSTALAPSSSPNSMVSSCHNVAQFDMSKSYDQQLMAALGGVHALVNAGQTDSKPVEARPNAEASPSAEPPSLHVPRSPGIPTRSQNPGDYNYQPPLHGHRFTKKFKVMATCDQCSKQMFLGLKCKDCKFRCHKDCESLVRSTCDEFLAQLQNNSRNSSPNGLAVGSSRSGRSYRKRSQDLNSSLGAYGAESAGSADSSCNSSTPSSPALFVSHTKQTTPVSVATLDSKSHFNFPDTTYSSIYKPTNMGHLTLETHMKRQEKPTSPRLKTNPPEVVIVGPKTDPPASVTPMRKDNALLSDGQPDNTQSEGSSSKESPCSTIRMDATEDPDDAEWSRQNSISLKEWDIPFEDINLVEKIGDGRFGTVHRAQWHGAVAVKLLKEDHLDTEAFRMEVATFKKTRHENVVLFMGACIKPQAIVTALCKGHTLYTHLHERRDKFKMGKTTVVAHQIARGMGYLHDRHIMHKDLKSKNIFLDSGKVIITDFALFSATKLDYDDRLGLCIPHGWLGYLAPEIMQRLSPCPPEHRDQLPLSKKSDIYAFGTIWYELLSNELPFRGVSAEATIFQVGRGMKQSLANLHASRDVKELLMRCWAYDVGSRPDFAVICRQLDMLPKKQLTRSPSHPVQMSRSAESVF